MGNGDLGAMLGAGVDLGAAGAPSPYSGLSFFLTKNDYWDVAVEARDKGCRYGIGQPRLYVNSSAPLALGAVSHTAQQLVTQPGNVVQPLASRIYTSHFIGYFLLSSILVL